jgi:hypothetical protein
MREPILLTLAILTQYRHFVTHTVLGLTDSTILNQIKAKGPENHSLDLIFSI